ncbi:MAG: methyltransferase domain-containing protein [Spirochaetes bacterium]|nr:methyltransferase domain-containing protein [Spirochaetota bacterium]
MLLISSDFYKTVLKRLIEKKTINENMKILITAGGEKDKNKFLDLKFKNVTITNVDSRMKKNSFLPYKYDYQDVENLTYKNEVFDISIVHHGLHHSPSPHKGLLELYRTSKTGIIVFEGLDNIITRLGKIMGIGENYELAAVKGGNYKFGGFKNSGIPNFVYRWTNNEVYKTIASFEPRAKPCITFFYGLEIPFKRLKSKKNKLPYLIAFFSFPFLFLFFIIFHRFFSNRYAFFIKKPDIKKEHFKWLKFTDNKIIPDNDYIKNIIK